MKTYYKSDLNKTYLIIEGEAQEIDYQSIVLKENQIAGLLKTDMRYLDNQGQYHYDISGKNTLRLTYEKKKLKYEDICDLVEAILQTQERVKKYMLSGNRLLLEPEYIYCEKGKFYFCYYPQQEQTLTESFHELTEYFVREVDYQDERGVHLAYVLHKATMEENYSIEQIMEEFIETVPREVEEVSFTPYESEDVEQEILVAEKKDMWEPVKRLLDKAKKQKRNLGIEL